MLTITICIFKKNGLKWFEKDHMSFIVTKDRIWLEWLSLNKLNMYRCLKKTIFERSPRHNENKTTLAINVVVNLYQLLMFRDISIWKKDNMKMFPSLRIYDIVFQYFNDIKKITNPYNAWTAVFSVSSFSFWFFFIHLLISFLIKELFK